MKPNVLAKLCFIFLCLNCLQVFQLSLHVSQGFQYFSSLTVLHYLQAVLFFNQNLNNFHEYLIQKSLKSGGTKYHFRQVHIPPLFERPVLCRGEVTLFLLFFKHLQSLQSHDYFKCKYILRKFIIWLYSDSRDIFFYIVHTRI